MPSIILRAGTYLVPSIPVEFFMTVLEYIEAKLGYSTTLLYESRHDTPKSDINDPFASGYLDIAWMTSSAYLKLKSNSSPVHLIPITTVHQHTKGEGCYTDIIMHKDLSGIVKEFLDLRGYGFAHDKQHSFNSHTLTQSKLKSMGEQHSSFFSNFIFTGSHVQSIKAVIEKKVEAAAVDANSLAFFLKKNPDLAKEIDVLTSWGPLPPYACVVRSNLNDAVKSSLHNCLYEMHTTDIGEEKLKEFNFNIRKFAYNDTEEFVKNALEYEKVDSKTLSAYY